MGADFLIVGGGIGGTVLAELLGRGGKRVVVLERSTAPPKWVRPEVLWPATVRLLFSLLPEEALKADALLHLRGVEVTDGRQSLVSVTPEVLRGAGVQPWSTDPNRTREHLLGLGAFELRRGVEVVEILRDGGRPVGVRTRDTATGEEREVLARVVVGDDGVNSLVRKSCGIELRTQLFPLDFLCFEFAWPEALKAATGHVWPNLGRAGTGIAALLAVPLPRGRGAGLVLAEPRVFEESRAAAVGEEWARFCARDRRIGDVVGDRKFPGDLVRVRRPWGHAPRYGCDGAILVGDAAHPVSPAGGQGANMSVADARALAEIALGNDGGRLLDVYERRRRPANERSLRFTRAAAAFLSLPDWAVPVPLITGAVKLVGRRPWLVRPLLRGASTAFQD